MQYLIAFAVGGAICAAAQIILDTTNLQAAHILVGLVSLGAILSGLGLYEPFQKFAGAGALVPVLGFGSSITKGMLSEIKRLGWEGGYSPGGLLKSRDWVWPPPSSLVPSPLYCASPKIMQEPPRPPGRPLGCPGFVYFSFGEENIPTSRSIYRNFCTGYPKRGGIL